MITVENLTKKFGGVTAVEGLTFQVEEDEVFGFLGPNGAGKTTTIRMLCCLISKTSGEARIGEYQIDKPADSLQIRKMIGLVPDNVGLYDDLTAFENLDFYGKLYECPEGPRRENIERFLKMLGLWDRKDTRAGSFSKGMKQKLALCCALIHKPAVIFLDEPTTGVDAVSRMEFWEMLRRLKESNITIMVSTPYMDEASLCDRVALIQDGKIMKISRPEEIVADYRYRLWAVRSGKFFELLSDLHAYPGVHSVHAFGQAAHVAFDKSALSIDDLRRHLIHTGHSDVFIEEISPTIEDCFMELMSNEQ